MRLTFLWFFAYYVMLCTTNIVPNTLCYTQCSQQLWWMVYTNTFRSTQKVQTRPYISYFLWQTNNCNLHGNIDKERYLSRYIVSYRIKSDIILITIEIHSGGIISGWDAIGMAINKIPLFQGIPGGKWIHLTKWQCRSEGFFNYRDLIAYGELCLDTVVPMVEDLLYYQCLCQMFQIHLLHNCSCSSNS